MKLRFKHQQFQMDAAKAVVDVFKGQPKDSKQYQIDPGIERQASFFSEELIGWKNAKIAISAEQVLENLKKVQCANQLPPSEKIEGMYNLTIEMETGVGKTYTYIKTIYELNKAYGWSKFIVVVPSIAIREGVNKSFETMQEHFVEEYNKKIRFFIYNSTRLAEIQHFASDNNINVMIINSQAFNATGKDARRIDMELDEFKSRKPRDVIAATNPILIIDEPQSVEGPKTKEGLKKFNPLLTLRYSATHKADSLYNMVYRLDAIDAYNKRLVKKIEVIGIKESGVTGAEGYLYFEGVKLNGRSGPTAVVSFHCKVQGGVKERRAIVDRGFSIYEHSGNLDEYRNGYVVNTIDGRTNTIELLNGQILHAGDVIGKTNESAFRRIQIRETIKAHIEREHELFKKGIKVLSLFFIDEVAKYRLYENGAQKNGEYAEIFEEEYDAIAGSMQRAFGDDDYVEYLRSITAETTHAGYFSIDKKGNMIDGKVDREGNSDDVDAYDLIMKNKELLLDLDPKRSPVRFIFSHSALREGWDNPNVFQICTLKQSSSTVRKRQEIGRGLRLCVNREGDRMDENALGKDVHNVNRLTIVASESYERFSESLQNELAESVSTRPRKVTPELFVGKELVADGNKRVIDDDLANEIWFNIKANGYIDKKGVLTEKYYNAKADDCVVVAEEVKEYAPQIVAILDSVHDTKVLMPTDRRKNNVEPKVNAERLNCKAFQELWKRINHKTYYLVNFKEDDLIVQAVSKLDLELTIAKFNYTITHGAAEQIDSKETLIAGKAFKKVTTRTEESSVGLSTNDVKYDLVGRLVDETGLTRRTIVEILRKMSREKFNQFKYNPEEFIAKAAHIINEAKGSVIVQHIAYDLLNEEYETNIFTEPGLRGQLDVNAMATPDRHLFDYLVYDSSVEKKFAEDLEVHEDVAVYVKLPNKFYISTPVGRYNPDWAIAFTEGKVKHVYFVAETKGSNDSLQLKGMETARIECARKHFARLAEEHRRKFGDEGIVYDVVASYGKLMEIVNPAY